MTSPSWFPRSTTLVISPSNYAIQSGVELALTGTVKYGTAEVSGGTITWKVTAGSLDKAMGPTVVFTAPSVTSNESITVSASFSGTGVYQPSSATAHLTVSLAKPKETVLTVSPMMFELHGGSTLGLNASLSPSAAPSQLITWSLSPVDTGSLSSTTGTSVTFTASTVTQNTSVTITASFPGNAQYASSRANSNGSILAPQVALKKSTVVSVLPSSFSLQSAGSQTLTATVKDIAGKVLPKLVVAWTVVPANVGSLSNTTGTSVTYTAPAVQQNTTVTVTASFAGNSTYLGSSGNSIGVVTPPSMLPYLYTLTFSSATMTNLRFSGPIIMNGTSVTLTTSDKVDMSGFRLNRLGLNATEMSVSGFVLYTTYLKLSSTSGGAATVINGTQTVNTGPTASATFGNATFYVVRMEGNSANATGLTSTGSYIGGSEPYVPDLITAPSCSISHVYTIEGPETWGSLVDESSEINMGEISLQQFSFVHPIVYSLNRQTNTYSSTNLWLMKASSATALNVTAYMIYFQATALGTITVTATGGELIRNVIPYGYNAGAEVSLTDLSVHAVSFDADSMTLGSFVVSIG